jgi:methyltransferase-like protein
VGTLFGMSPAPVAACRILEVGCGDGGNLIPMAYHLPKSRFFGIDLADEAIAAGRRTAAELGFENVTLEAADLCRIGRESGEFDYIISHGLYSWAPPHVRDALLRVCRECLAPQGIAFVSYNALPGRHLREMFREMMRYHVRAIENPAERILKSREFLELMLGARMLSPAMSAIVEQQAKALLAHDDGALFHDDLADINDPVYFRDFAAHAARHGLQYLGEADFFEMFDPRGSLAFLGDDFLEREQYLDFLRLRMFRQTLLCHDGIALDRRIGPQSMERFLFSAPFKEVEGGQIEGLHAVRISALDDIVRRVTAAMGEVYPLPLSFDELEPYAGDRTALAEILFALFTGGFAEIHVYDFPCEETVTERPRASRLARYQASRGRYVASACHHVVELDEMGRALMPLLDGTRTVGEIADVMGARPEQVRSAVEEFARLALIEA